MISMPRTGNPSVAKFVLFMVVLGSKVAIELATGEFIGRRLVIQRANDPAVYWTSVNLEIVILLGGAGIFLYRSMTRD